MALLNIAARLSTGFSDFYVLHIFPVLSTPFAFISGLLPFSLGEVMIVLLLLIIALGIPALIILLIIKKEKCRFIGSIAVLTAIWTVTYILVTETLNCFIMYQCTPFSGRYLSHKEHTRSELVELYGILIEKSNELAVQVPRDEKGRFFIT
ncbi:MAG: DUF3810 family protein, partial [Ruminococcus sp.]|nr:DUF3810 family protein [Ruminococcus sp.]